MVKAGKCKHPEAVFVIEYGELGGRLPGADGQLSRFLRRAPNRVTADITMKLAERLFGQEALLSLAGISATSLPHYRNGNRVLPDVKLLALRVAIRTGALMLGRPQAKPQPKASTCEANRLV